MYQLREYRPGDDIRQIHWKLSSKLDELILKEASQPESRSLLVFWDKRTGTPQQMDALAEVVSSTGAALLQGGVQYTLSWTEGDDLQAQDILDENQLLQAIPELVKTRGSADCRLPEMGDYSRILYFGVKPGGADDDGRAGAFCPLHGGAVPQCHHLYPSELFGDDAATGGLADHAKK